MKIRDFIAEKIKKLYDQLGCQALIEIGLGKGVLTKKICQVSSDFFIIEMDKSLGFQWENSINPPIPPLSRGTVIYGDVLEVDVDKFLDEKGIPIEQTLISGNLPYYITSPIFRKFFEGGQKYAGGVFMIQDEVAEKMKSDADKKSYLWWLINYAYDVTYLKGVPAKCFNPAPRVKSAVIQLTPKTKIPKIDYIALKQFLDLFAPYSRKTLGAIQKIVEKHAQTHPNPSLIKEGLIQIPEDLRGKRLEELGWNDIEKIL